MFTGRFEMEMEWILWELRECERQIEYHRDEMLRAHRRGETGIECHHRQEQLQWERKMRQTIRELILVEHRLERARQESEKQTAREVWAKRVGVSRKSW
jgi:hypothetical protein